MNKLSIQMISSVMVTVVLFKCAASAPPEGSKISESSRDAGGVTPAPLPTTPSGQPGTYGADAGDAGSKATVHKCLLAGQVIDRKGLYACLEAGKPPLNIKLRSFADLKDPTKFPVKWLTQLQSWMDKPEKNFKEQHFDFAVSCRTGVPDNSICKDANGAAITNATVLAFARNDEKGATVVSSTIINDFFD